MHAALPGRARQTGQTAGRVYGKVPSIAYRGLLEIAPRRGPDPNGQETTA
jgi:hypothetical protein